MALASQMPPPTIRTRKSSNTAFAIRRSRAVSTYLSPFGGSGSFMPQSYRAMATDGMAQPQRLSSRHCFLHHLDQLLEGERLGEEVELRRIGQALVEGILGVTRHEDDLDIGLALLELLHQRGPVHFRHDNVRDDDVDFSALLFELLQRLDSIAGLDHGVAARLQPA